MLTQASAVPARRRLLPRALAFLVVISLAAAGPAESTRTRTLPCLQGGDDFQNDATWGALDVSGACSTLSAFGNNFETSFADPTNTVILPGGPSVGQWVVIVQHHFDFQTINQYSLSAVVGDAGGSTYLDPNADAIEFVSLWVECGTSDPEECLDEARNSGSDYYHDESRLCISNPSTSVDCQDILGAHILTFDPLSPAPRALASAASRSRTASDVNGNRPSVPLRAFRQAMDRAGSGTR